jgi:hypothetical protein
MMHLVSTIQSTLRLFLVMMMAIVSLFLDVSLRRYAHQIPHVKAHHGETTEYDASCEYNTKYIATVSCDDDGYCFIVS